MGGYPGGYLGGTQGDIPGGHPGGHLGDTRNLARVVPVAVVPCALALGSALLSWGLDQMPAKLPMRKGRPLQWEPPQVAAAEMCGILKARILGTPLISFKKQFFGQTNMVKKSTFLLL